MQLFKFIYYHAHYFACLFLSLSKLTISYLLVYTYFFFI